MGIQFSKGTLVYRTWEKGEGLQETRQAFDSAADLFRMCLEARDPNMVDRVILQGQDAHGDERTVVLTFTSLTRREDQAHQD